MNEKTKQHLMRSIRRFGLMPWAERIRSKLLMRRTIHSNRRFCSVHPEIVLPPPHLMHDPFGTVDFQWYWETGKDSAAAISEVINQRSLQKNEPLRILEWGCGLGRIIRHLQTASKTARYELHGSDYNADMVEWCGANLPQIDFTKNELAPPLPHPDDFFDFIYCLSVFTHLSESMHHAWLAELLRVLKPGGRILLTLHGDYYRRKMMPDELEHYSAGSIVVREGFKEGGRMYTAFHGEQFIRNEFLQSVEILGHHTSENAIAPPQDVWVVRKPESPISSQT